MRFQHSYISLEMVYYNNGDYSVYLSSTVIVHTPPPPHFTPYIPYD